MKKSLPPDKQNEFDNLTKNINQRAISGAKSKPGTALDLIHLLRTYERLSNKGDGTSDFTTRTSVEKLLKDIIPK